MIIKIICIICVAGIVVLAAILLESKRENHTLAVTEYNIKDKRIKQPFRIVMLADLHNAEFGAENTALIDKIKKNTSGCNFDTWGCYYRKSWRIPGCCDSFFKQDWKRCSNLYFKGKS